MKTAKQMMEQAKVGRVVESREILTRIEKGMENIASMGGTCYITSIHLSMEPEDFKAMVKDFVKNGYSIRFMGMNMAIHWEVEKLETVNDVIASGELEE